MRLAELASRAQASERLLLGLMSGMSMDGLDHALVRVEGAADDPRPQVTLVASDVVPHDDELRSRLRAARDGDRDEALSLDRDLGGIWGDMALSFLATHAVAPKDVVAIGSHGQTLHHLPRDGDAPAATWQVGHPSGLARATGIPVVGDLRPADIAAGGEGAPLVPIADWILYADPARPVACLNLGSIANVTVVTPDPADLLAFDTGPANTLLDAAVRAAPEGEAMGGIDVDGACAATGAIADDLLLALYMRRSAWLAAPPPRSAGYGTFGPGLLDEVAEALAPLSLADRLRTLAEFTALATRDAFAWHVVTRHPELEVVHVSGGGTRNDVVMSRLAALLGELGLEVAALPAPWPDAKEAVAFALLADRTLRGLPGNAPTATGAIAAVPLGVIALP